MFNMMIFVCGVLFCVCVLKIVATKKYVISIFYVMTRSYLTSHLHAGYFTDVVYYSLNVLDESVDNP